jgi:hypothetical protein
MGGGFIVEKTPELLERLKDLKADTKAPADYNRLVEYSPNAYGPAEDEEPGTRTKQKAAEKAKA